MRAFFWDCQFTGQQSAYSELLITDSKRSSREIKALRDARYQAITAARFKAAPLAQTACDSDDVAAMLRLVLSESALAGTPHRYERLIVIQRGRDDDITGLVTFLRHWFPRIVQENRLFVVKLAAGRAIGQRSFDNALGLCRLGQERD